MGGEGSGGYRGNIINIKCQAELKKLLEYRRNKAGHQKMATACWLAMRELIDGKEDFMKLFPDGKERYDELLARWSRTEDEVAFHSRSASWKRELKKRGYNENMTLEEVKALSRIDNLRKNSKLSRELEDAEERVAHWSAQMAKIKKHINDYPNMSKLKRMELKDSLSADKRNLAKAQEELEFVRMKLENAINI